MTQIGSKQLNNIEQGAREGRNQFNWEKKNSKPFFIDIDRKKPLNLKFIHYFPA
jgi:hypothetical protein